MALITGIHHVSMKCTNEEELNKVIHFYRDILELEVIRTWSAGIMFSAGKDIIEVFTNGEEQLPQGVIRHFAFATKDVDECARRVAASGYKTFMGPKDIEIPSNPSLPARIVFCIGPLGEEIEFFDDRSQSI